MAASARAVRVVEVNLTHEVGIYLTLVGLSLTSTCPRTYIVYDDSDYTITLSGVYQVLRAANSLFCVYFLDCHNGRSTSL